MVILAVVVILAGAWLVHRRRKAVMLAGLQSSRPVFSVEPPTRRMSGIDRETL